MAYKTLRQARYEDLRLLGFLPFEARFLSKIPRNVPYMKDLAKERAAERSKWVKKKATEKEWETHIIRVYRAKGWVIGTNKVRSASSVYNMLRHKREQFLPNYPEYGSPSKARDKHFRKWQGDFEKRFKETKPPSIPDIGDWKE